MSKTSFTATVVVSLLVGGAAGYGIQTYLAQPGMTAVGATASLVPSAAAQSEASPVVAQLEESEPAESPAAAQPEERQASPEEGALIAIVNGQNLYESDLVSFLQRLPPQVQAQAQMLMPQILEQVVNNELATQAGRKAGLASDSEVLRQMSRVEDLIVGQTFLQREIEAMVTAEKIDAAYQKYLAENPPQRELTARHILLETEEAAKEVIAELDAGADFAELAKERSTGPSGATGGELPPFRKGQMVAEFSDAAFAMEVGSHSKAPVQTQFGYHVILLEGSAMTEPPAKSEVEGELREQLSQEAAEAVVADLREGAQIEVLYGQSDQAPEGEPAPPAEAMPQGGETESAPANNQSGNN